MPNIVLAEDARLWQQIIFGEALSFEEPALRTAREAGPEFFTAAAKAISDRPDLAALRSATGPQGRGILHAAAGGTDRPAAWPRARAAAGRHAGRAGARAAAALRQPLEAQGHGAECCASTIP